MEPLPRSDRALQGMRVLVTRPLQQGDDPLAAGLRRLGADVISLPLTRIEPAPDPAALQRLAREASTFDWLIFTSANGVAAFWKAAEAAGADREALGGRSVACVGPGTARALEERGVTPRLVAGVHHAEGLLAALVEAGVQGARVLLPQAVGARAVLADGLRAAGAELTVVAAYRSVADASAEVPLAALRSGRIDVVTFTASSAVHSFLELAGADIGQARVAVIGPVTAEAARAGGLPVDIEASQHTVEGLVAALAAEAAGGWGRAEIRA